MGLISKLNKLYSWFEEYGTSAALFLVAEHLMLKAARRVPYCYWTKYWETRWDDLGRWVSISSSFQQRPLFSVIIANDTGNHLALSSCLRSVSEQVYDNWELHVATHAMTVEESEFDTRVRFHSSESLWQGLNKALDSAKGEFILLIGSDWIMSRYCLFEFALLLNTSPLVDVIYSDHDNIDVNGRRFNPVFKPQWCPDSYFSGVFSIFPGAYRTALLRSIDGFDYRFEPCFEWDLGLRITETTNRIARIPAVLFHRRLDETEELPSCTDAIVEASISALERSLRKRGQSVNIKPVEGYTGKYLVRYRRTDSEKVSIIIPTRDHSKELNSCLESVFSKSTYRNFEVVLVDNQSRRTETAEVIAKWKGENPDIFHTVNYEDEFNYSRVNNVGVVNASGSYLVFLNNDTEVVTEDWIEALMEYAQMPSIGAVGALLLYPNGRVQHAGVVVGLHGCADHVFRHFREADWGYECRLQTVTNYSAVTAACMMCRREVFEQAGGFDENLPISFNDVDLCLKFVELGYRNVYLPHVKLYHHESFSRGKDDTEEKLRRTDREIAYIRSRWKKYIDDDPCYNPNLTRQDSDFSVRVDDLRMELSLLPKRKVKI